MRPGRCLTPRAGSCPLLDQSRSTAEPGSHAPSPAASLRYGAASLVRLGLVLLATLGLTAGALTARHASDGLFYAAVGLQSGLALLAARILVRHPSRIGWFLVVVSAALLRAYLLVEPPLLSGDIYRYIWDGRVVNAGYNPYSHVPTDPVLAPLRDPAQFVLIDKRDYAVTIYPPVAEAFFALVTRISGSVSAMKLAMVLSEGAAMLAVARLLERSGRPRALLALYLLHPAPIWEIAGNGHVDALMMAFGFGALAWGAMIGRPYWAALLLTLGALVKFIPALALPSVWKPFDWRLPAFVIAVAVLCYLPFLSAGLGVAGFLPGYAHEQGLANGEGFFPLAALRRLGLFRPWMTGAYLAGAGIALFGLAVWARRPASAMDPVRTSALLIIAFLLLLTPSLPWYYLMAGPFTPLLGLWTPFAMLTGGFLLYGFNADQLPFFARWSLLMAVIAVAVIRDLRHAWRLKEVR